MLMPPFDEVARLQALRDLAILDTAAEESFDELTRTAALVCQMPIALISLIDEHRQWFKAKVGLDAVETPREVAFCDHAIRRSDELLEVGDATKDPRFSANPLVTGAPDIRFYAGAPLVDANGHALGTLCVIDRRPRHLEPWQREVLGHLARQVVRLFAARSLAKGDRSSTARAAVPTIDGLVRQVPSGAVAVGPHGRIQVNQAACTMLGIPAAELPDLNTWFARLCGDRAAEMRALYEADRAAGFPDPRQVWVTRGDGERRLVEFHGVNTAQGEMWLVRDITDTVGAEERFRVLFEHSSDAHLLFDERGIIDCNQAAIALLRCPDKRQLLSVHPAKLSPEFQPDGRRSDEKCIEMDRLARERGYHRFEWQHRRMDGSDFPVEVTLTPVQLHGHGVLLVVWHDLTERKQAEESERQREHRWLLALEASGDGVWDWDLTSNRIFYSPRWKAMLGYADHEIGDTIEEWESRVHPEDLQRAMTDVARHVAGEAPQYVNEHRIRCRDGAWKWILDRGMVVERHADGRPKRMIGTKGDLTERRTMEDALRLEQERFRAMSDASPVGIYVTDVAGRATYLNDRWCALAGLERDVALGDGWSATLHPDDRAGVYARWTSAVSDGTQFDAEYRFRHHDGSIIWCHGMAAPMRLGEQVVGYVGSIADITVLKQAAEEMRQARDLAEKAANAKADFLATMSHELRTPMNGVIGMSTLLLDTPLNQQQKEFAETVRLCGDQLLALINDILDFSKIEAGSLALEHIPFSPRRLGEEAVALLADQAEKKGLQIVCLIGSEVPARLLGDPTRLRQVLLNLLSNAVKFTERGEVVLSITNHAAAGQPLSIELAVRDSGIGISTAARERLFKPFSQADSSTTRKYGGTGLGLVICMRLVQLMGGTIALDSVLGSGSTFTCRLPLPMAPDAEPEPGHDGLIGRQALVVASSPTARRALREQLIGWGMTCAECPDVAGIAAAVAPMRPAVVIIDHDLPGGGLTLSRHLADQPATAGIPIVLLVAGAHRGMATAAKEAGIAGFLTKPVRHAQLFECLLVVLNQACRVGDQARVAQPLLVTRHSLDEERAPRRVLVVEDNPVNRQVAVMMLNKLGCRCDIATNGQEAVEAVARQDYQVVFMDCQMPVMDGFAAATEIRRQEAGNRRVRIVALTANAMQGDRERCLTAGMDDYVSKPIKSTDLEVALARTDQRKPAAAALVTSTSQELVIDDSALQGLLDATDQETLTAVAEMLRVDAGTSLADLRQAASVGDGVSLGRTAHRLKGSSGTLGLRRVQELCHQLEQAGRARQIDQAGALVEALAAALAEALPALAAHRLVSGG